QDRLVGQQVGRIVVDEEDPDVSVDFHIYPREKEAGRREPRALLGCVAHATANANTPPFPPFARGGGLSRAGPSLFPPYERGGQGGAFGRGLRACATRA